MPCKYHHDKFSTTAALRCGVPQGSILRPLLSLLYITDIPQAVDYHLFLYADDTRLLYQHRDLDQISKELQIFIIYVTDLSITS